MKPVLSIAAVVLAAGSSRRFGSDKRQYRYRGAPLLQQVLAKPLAMGLPTLVVLKPEDAVQLPMLLGSERHPAPLTPVYAPRAAEGMAYSLAAAATAAQQHCYDALLVMLADMPEVTTNTLQQLCDHADKKSICVPRHNGVKGNPVLFGSGWFAALQLLEGDCGARGVIRQHPEAVVWVDVDDPGILLDFDQPPG